MTGNIIANTGFIKQYGTVVSNAGVVSLAANHIAIWAGESDPSVRMMTGCPLTSDIEPTLHSPAVLWSDYRDGRTQSVSCPQSCWDLLLRADPSPVVVSLIVSGERRPFMSCGSSFWEYVYA